MYCCFVDPNVGMILFESEVEAELAMISLQGAKMDRNGSKLVLTRG